MFSGRKRATPGLDFQLESQTPHIFPVLQVDSTSVTHQTKEQLPVQGLSSVSNHLVTETAIVQYQKVFKPFEQIYQQYHSTLHQPPLKVDPITTSFLPSAQSKFPSSSSYHSSQRMKLCCAETCLKRTVQGEKMLHLFWTPYESASVALGNKKREPARSVLVEEDETLFDMTDSQTRDILIKCDDELVSRSESNILSILCQDTRVLLDDDCPTPRKSREMAVNTIQSELERFLLSTHDVNVL